MKNITKVLLVFSAVVIAYVLWLFFPVKVYFLESGDNTPIVNKALNVMYNPTCVASPCEAQQVVYDGKTGSDGSIILPARVVRLLNIDFPGFEDGYEYAFKVDGYVRDKDASELAKEKNVVYLTESKDRNERITLKLHQIISIPNAYSDFIGNREYLFQLSVINQDGSIELEKRLGKGVFENIHLQKGVPSYIPGEITDSQLFLDDVTADTASFHLVTSSTMNTWESRKIDYGKFLKMPYVPSYQEAMDEMQKDETAGNEKLLFYGLDLYGTGSQYLAELHGEAVLQDNVCFVAEFDFVSSHWQYYSGGPGGSRDPLYIDQIKQPCTLDPQVLCAKDSIWKDKYSCATEGH